MNNKSGVLQNRSISDVILPLRASCFDSDYKAAVRELLEREEALLKEKEEIVATLRERNGILEADLGDWKIRYCTKEEECCRWKRDLYENEELLKELRRGVSLTMEKEERDIRRYERLLVEIQGLEDERSKNNQELMNLSYMVDDLKMKLKEKEDEMAEIVGRKNAELELDLGGLRKNLEVDACSLDLHQEKGESLKEVFKKKDVDFNQLEAHVKVRQAEYEGMLGTNPYLEGQREKYDAHVEELRKSNEVKDEKIKKLLDLNDRLQIQIEEIKKANDEPIKELKKKNEGLGVKNKELTAKLGQANEQLLKLEGDMYTFMCFNLERDPNFASAPVGKVFSGIIMALDPENSNLIRDAGVAKDGISQEADAVFVSLGDLTKRRLKPEKQSRKAVERPKRTLFAKPINMSDDENGNGVKNKRQCQRNHVGPSDDTLNPIHNLKKYKHVPCEQVMLEPSHAVLSASRSDSVSNTFLNQRLATLKQCHEKHGRKDKVASSRLSNGDDSKNSYGSSEAIKHLNPQVEELMTSIQQRKQNKKLENAADMVCAFERDDNLCANAVCALHRLQMAVLSGANDLICLGGSKGLEGCDIGRVSALAKILTDGDPNGKMKKSVNELPQEDREECKRLALKYNQQLFYIYSKSTSVCYRVK